MCDACGEARVKLYCLPPCPYAYVIFLDEYLYRKLHPNGQAKDHLTHPSEPKALLRGWAVVIDLEFYRKRKKKEDSNDR